MSGEILQGTPEWKEERRGKLTASRFQDAIATLKSGGWGRSRANYAAEIIAERLTGVFADHYISAEMQWGTDHEPQAKAAYAFQQNVEIANIGFVNHPTIAMAGASCDSLVGKDGLAEYKCPLTASHLDYIEGRAINIEYITQMHWQLACRPERKWCDFVSFDPRLPPKLRLFIRRVNRDVAIIKRLETEAVIFLREISDRIAALEKRFGKLR